MRAIRSAPAAREISAAGGDGGATFVRPKVAKSRRGDTPQNILFCGDPGDLTPSVAPHRDSLRVAPHSRRWRAPDPPRLLSRGGPVRGPSPRRRGGPLLPLDEGRGAGNLAAEIIPVSARFLAILPKPRGSFGTRDAASPAPPGSVPKVGCPVFDRAKIPRPKRRGLRGNMVPFPAALCAAGTPMGWTLVAPFLELPPSCAALAALANRARPAVRCRTAFPQKCRDGGPGGASSLPVWHLALNPPGAFSLGPPGGPFSFVPHCAQRSGGPFNLIDSGRPTQGLPASNAALAARPRRAVAASPRKREWGADRPPPGR